MVTPSNLACRANTWWWFVNQFITRQQKVALFETQLCDQTACLGHSSKATASWRQQNTAGEFVASACFNRLHLFCLKMLFQMSLCECPSRTASQRQFCVWCLTGQNVCAWKNARRSAVWCSCIGKKPKPVHVATSMLRLLCKSLKHMHFLLLHMNNVCEFFHFFGVFGGTKTCKMMAHNKHRDFVSSCWIAFKMGLTAPPMNWSHASGHAKSHAPRCCFLRLVFVSETNNLHGWATWMSGIWATAAAS